MSKENLPVFNKKAVRRKVIPNSARVALVAGLSFVTMSCVNDSANASIENFHGITSPTPTTLIVKDKNDQFSDSLNDNYVKAGLAGALGMAIGMSVTAYYLGKRHDEAMLKALRIAGPLTMAAGASAGLVDSFITINRYIPSSLFLATTFLIAGYQVKNTFVRYKDPKIRAGALLAAGTLSSIGITAFMAFR